MWNAARFKQIFGPLLLLPFLPIVSASGQLRSLPIEWTVRLDTISDTTPAIGADGTIYFGTFEGRLCAINPDGTRKWSFRTEREICSSPALGNDGTIYFGSRDRKLYAVRPDGKLSWKFQTGAWVDASPALGSDGSIYFGSWDKKFYALTPAGEKRWQFQTEGEIVSSAGIGSDGTIYFGSHDKKLYALTPDGNKRWEFASGGPVLSSPALDAENNVYFSSVDGFFYTVTREGRLRWRLHTGGITQSSPVLGPTGMIYVGVNTNMWALNPNGTIKWKRDAADYMDNSALVLADGTICFSSRYGMLMGIDPETSLYRWGYYLCPTRYNSPAIGPNGAIYIMTSNEKWVGFSALRLEGTLAPGPWPKFQANPRNTGILGP